MRHVENSIIAERREHWSINSDGSEKHSSADFYPRVVELQRRIGAAGFIIASTTKAMNAISPLKVILSNSSFPHDDEAQKTLRMVEARLSAHVKFSPCPVFWNSDQEPRGSLEFSKSVKIISIDEALMSGLAFPVHMGGRQTGIAIFFAPSITITREMQMDIHRKIYAILKELLKIEAAVKGDVIAINGRETECLQFAGNGMTSDDIAERLGLSVHTVNAHLGSATAKLDSVNRIQAIAKAIRLGLIS